MTAENNTNGAALTPTGGYSYMPKPREHAFVAVDPGHRYTVNTMEGKQTDIIFINKRLAEGQPAGTLETVHDGLTNKAVIAVLISRMHYLQAINPCNENEEVLQGLKIAQNAIERRACDRQMRNVQGTNKA